MSDLTRTEAIKWCKDNKCDFNTPVYPPPDGWMWAYADSNFSKTELTLASIFTSNEPDIFLLDTI